ncbi:unnamed protein product [Adineta steineri]|uniref:RTA1-domain-containing protein n=1 Tax=Adineta steineri TaxID=433720 RepID=A0A814KH10_9BILA|nr:unnamed protein product [Adineta steineri]CAF1050731.1 unnamed protein product [Adineta steineri]
MSNGNTTLSYTPGGADDPSNPFHYMPSLAPTIVSLIFFILLFISLTILTIWKRSWYMITLLVGCILEIIGYGTRIPLVSKPVGQIPLYACMNGCLIIAPVFNAAIEYVLFGRLVHALGDQYSLIKPKLISWIFIICDAFSFLIQISGAGLLTSAKDGAGAQTGQTILLAGLGINLGSFAIFCLQLFYFEYRIRKSPPIFPNGSIYEKRWRRFVYIIYLSSTLVLIRQIYRVIEFAQGFTGYLAVHEIFFYIFDTIPIFISSALYVICFPGNNYLPPNQNDTFATMNNNEYNSNKTNNNVIIPEKNLVLKEMF